MPPIKENISSTTADHEIPANTSGLMEGLVTSPAPPQPADTDVGQYKDSSPWYVSSVVDSFYHPAKTLLTHVSGMRWPVTYYQQMRDSDEPLNTHQLGKNGVYQQYRKIERFILRVSDGLRENQDLTNSNVFDVEGQATIYSSLIGNVGDTFIADIGDGREGVFTVVTSKRMTLLKATCYEITYKLRAITAVRPEIKQDLENKTVQTFVYHENYLKHGLNPFLTKEETVDHVRLSERLERIAKEYLGEFFNYQINTLILPAKKSGKVEYLYDPWLTEFVIKTMEGAKDQIRLMNVNGGSAVSAHRRNTFWDLILERTDRRARTMIAKAGWYGNKTNFSQPNLNAIQWSPVEAWRVGVMDLSGEAIIANELNNQMGVGEKGNVWAAGWPVWGGCGCGCGGGDAKPDVVDDSYYLDLEPALPLPDPIPETGFVPPLVWPEGQTDYYILSEYWYKQERPFYSTLESALDDYLNNEPVAFDKITLLVSDMDNWPQLTRYQCTPIVYALAKMVLHGY